MKLFAFFATIFLVAALGFLVGYFLKTIVLTWQKQNLEEQLSKLRAKAQDKATDIIATAEQAAAKLLGDARDQSKRLDEESAGRVSRLEKREQYLDERQTSLTTAEHKVERDKNRVNQQQTELEVILREQRKNLETIAEMSIDEAKQYLLSQVEKLHQADLLARIGKLEKTGRSQLEDRAQDIILSAIQRYGNAVNNDIMSQTVILNEDDIKGKIIGKEGRNIKSFEKATGVQLVIDDTPNTITISSFDPVRRAIAKTALEDLIADGRIQPARIEEIVEHTRDNIQQIITTKAEEAAAECGVFGLDPELLQILGTLYFRYSYGQNVLQHSVEMAHIAGMIAEQLGADAYVAKAGALLHDIGKAVDHEVEGTHVEIGRRLLKRYGVDDEIIKAMQSHHDEYPYENAEAVIVQVADAISGARPGARSDNADMYLEKMEGLERIARSLTGVTDAYAISAGREIRVFVNPDAVDDYGAAKVAREVAAMVERELKYPGEIKVNVIRESRVIEYAR